MERYYNNAYTPAANYGKQLWQLDQIRQAVAAWENKHGATNLPVVRRKILGETTESKRRRAVHSVKTQLDAEETLVQNQGHTVVTNAHAADRKKLLSVVTAGRWSKDRRLRSSRAWILTARKTTLFAVTPTGDSYARLKASGFDPARDQAFFPKANAPGGAGNIVNGVVTYNKNDLTDQTNVLLRKNGKNLGGWNNPGFVAVIGAAQKTDGEIQKAVRHEVQHDADKSQGRDASVGLRRAGEAADAAGLGWDASRGALDTAGVTSVPGLRAATAASKGEVKLQRYKTEFRAYSYQEGAAGGPYSNLDNLVQNRVHDGQNFSERQLAIFKHIYSNYPNTKSGWDDNPVLADGVTTFRDAVAAYWRPDTEAFNKYNSPAVDDVYRALDALGTKAAPTSLERSMGVDLSPVTTKVSDKDDPGVAALSKLIGDLSKEDGEYIYEESPAMRAKIDLHLDGEAKAKILEDLEWAAG